MRLGTGRQRPVPMVTIDQRGSDRRARATRLDRNADRRITAAGIVVAAFASAVAVAATATPGSLALLADAMLLVRAAPTAPRR
jgi:Co/Zn/Cd efflux system component